MTLAASNESDETARQRPIRYTLPKSARMPAGRPYTLVFQQRKAVSDAMITVNVGPNGLKWHRLGLGVAKKMFRKAVARNRIKRLIREAFRLERPNFGGGLDMVIRPKVRELTLEDLRRSLRTLVPKAERKFGPDSNSRKRQEPAQITPEPETPPEVAGP